jgi:hypothetical protein
MGVRRKRAILVVCVAVAVTALCGANLAQPAAATKHATVAKKRATKSCKQKRKHKHRRHRCAKPKLPPPTPIPVPLPDPCPPCLGGPCLEKDVLVICDPPPCPPPCPSPGIHCPLPPVALYYPCVEPAVK